MSDKPASGDVCSTDGRDQFKTRFGFIMACIGSAVGMGNIWMFPYRTAQYGGAAFLIPYIIFVAILGFSGVIGEMAFGRAMGTGPLGAFKKAIEMKTGKKWGEYLGLIPVLGSLAIAIGYSVVVGWIIRFLVGSFTGSALGEYPGEYFSEISSNFGSVPWHLIGLFVTFLIMIFGIAGGIEKLNKVLMPLFFLLFAILAVRVLFLNGSSVGYSYLFNPNWQCLANPKTWIFALGQAFFSLSLAGSGTVVYGSYLSKSEDIISCAKTVAIWDTIAALIAAMAIIPALFVFNINLQAGPPLMFIAMPCIFKEMPLGQVFSVIFFIAVSFAAVTSLVNLFETPVEAIQQKFKLSRKTSVGIVALISVAVGLFIESANAVGTWMNVLSVYVIPLGALLAAVLFFWVLGDKFVLEQVQMGRKKTIGKYFKPMTKYVFVGLTLIVYILGLILGDIG